MRDHILLCCSLMAACATETPPDTDQVAQVEAAVTAPVCTDAELKALFEQPGGTAKVTCSVVFGRYQPSTPNGSKHVKKTIVLEGAASSRVLVDCQGGTIGLGGTAVFMRSRKLTDTAQGGTWEKLRGAELRNCHIQGRVAISGMDFNEGGDGWKSSRADANHTARAQAAAPQNLTLRGNTFHMNDTAVYVSIGAKGIKILGNRFVGSSASPTIYLDAESAGHRVADNLFEVNAGREVIAIDGSANNTITNNEFQLGDNNDGAIYIYRNCGERGMIRHQAPQRNELSGNRMARKYIGLNLPRWIPLPLPLVIVGSRQGDASYCGADNGFPWGSSANNGDFAEFNRVTNNRIWIKEFAPTPNSSADSVERAIKVTNAHNTVTGNTFGGW